MPDALTRSPMRLDTAARDNPCGRLSARCSAADFATTHPTRVAESGFTFWLTRKKLVGSYLLFTSTSRA